MFLSNISSFNLEQEGSLKFFGGQLNIMQDYFQTYNPTRAKWEELLAEFD
jgi:hypothetical protein